MPARVVIPPRLRHSHLANGTHEVQVEVADAAGNTIRSAVETVTVQNDGAPNGSRASRLAVLSGKIAKASRTTPLRRLVDFGQKVSLAGRLTDSAGAPIPERRSLSKRRSTGRARRGSGSARC